MRAAAAALALVAGCWRGDATPAPAEPTTTQPGKLEKIDTLCAELAFQGLMRGVIMINGKSGAPAFDTADAEAQHDYELASGAARTDMHRAATLFVSCAVRYRDVPDTDPLRGTADYNAMVCYENAMYSFAMAGAMATEGTEVLERALRDDPQLAPEIRRILASPPHDCAVRR